jgi:phage tail-like protein
MPVPEFTVNATRYDPYKNFRFRVKWDGRYVAGVSRVGGLTRTTEVVTHRDGGDPTTARKSPGQTTYNSITLERGITFDLEFERWANKVWSYRNSVAGPSPADLVSLRDFRRPITIELYNEAGQLVIAYNVYRCWPSSYSAMPELDSAGNAVAIESLTLENEGWERDPDVTELQEPSYDDPALVG